MIDLTMGKILSQCLSITWVTSSFDVCELLPRYWRWGSKKKHGDIIALVVAGTPLAGQIENLPRLKEICTQHGMWLHVLG